MLMVFFSSSTSPLQRRTCDSSACCRSIFCISWFVSALIIPSILSLVYL
ncbi:hypothetical protein LINPERPRIM_LOCUS11343 [Linum perenne]